MGKSHRKVSAGSCSENYHSPHARGFAKQKKAYSHHSIRTQNNNCDEESFNCKLKKMNTHWAASYIGDNENIPNCKGEYMDDKSLSTYYDYKWVKTDTSLLHSIEKIQNNGHELDTYLISSKKQVERRGTIGRFYGHRQHIPVDILANI